jgi:hypothetical protein
MMPTAGLNRTGKTVTHKTVTHKTVTDKTPTLTKLGKKPRLARPDRNPCVVLFALAGRGKRHFPADSQRLRKPTAGLRGGEGIDWAAGHRRRQLIVPSGVRYHTLGGFPMRDGGSGCRWTFKGKRQTTANRRQMNPRVGPPPARGFPCGQIFAPR